MEPVLIYIVQTVVCSGVLLLLYKVLLEQRVSYGLCRAYLVAAMIAGAVIPALDISVYTPEVVYYTPMAVSVALPTAEVVEAAPRQVDVWQVVYVSFVALGLALMLINIVRIYAMRRGAHVTLCRDYMLYESSKIKSPFSFFRNIFIGSGLSQHELSQVVAHESSHIRHHHSAELLLVEFLKALLWFNPFVWIMRRSLCEVHEFQADRDVLQRGYNIDEYRILIFKQLFGCNPDMTSGLNHSLTKKRFIMMTKQNNSRYSVLKLVAVLPLVTGLMMLFSFTRHETVYIEQAEQPTKQTVEKKSAADTLKGDVIKVIGVKNTTKGNVINVVGVRNATTADGKPAKNPLFILDGVRITPEQMRAISTDSIASISVLKDSASVAVYGEQGKDGVIMITSKSKQKVPAHTLKRVNIDSLIKSGGALILVDGQKTDTGLDINPDDIESISILKDTVELRKRGYIAIEHLVTITTKKKAATDNSDGPYIIVERMPKFLDGEISEFKQWVTRNLKYPVEAVKNGIQGRVAVSFVVEADGAVTNVTVLKGPQELVPEAVRVVMSSPKWTPGEQRGKKVRVKFVLPIDFKLPESKEK